MDEEKESIEVLFNNLPFELTEGQKKALILSTTSKGNVAICGSGGAGKSTILSLLKEYYGDKILFCGSTGISNNLLFDGKGGNGTAHRVFSLPLGMHNEHHVKKVGGYTQGLLGKSDLVEVICIEEFSMITPDQLALIEKRITRFNKKTRNRKRRNLRIILCGDILQIPPVISDVEKRYMIKEYGSSLLVKSDVFKRMDFEVAVLDEVKRTGDKTFLAALDVLRYGQEHRYEGVLKWLNKRANLPLPENVPVIASTNKRVAEVNDQALLQNKEDSFFYHAVITGKYQMKNCPVEEVVEMKVGMPIITVVNQPVQGEEKPAYSTGEFGYIEQCTTEGCWVYFPDKNESHFVDLFEFEERESEIQKDVLQANGTTKDVMNVKVVGSCITLPCKVAASMSCHRFQGKTISTKGIVDLGYGFYPDSDFGCNLLYVSLSRFTSVDNIYLQRPLNLKHIKVCRQSIDWWNEQLEKQKVINDD